MEAGQSRFRHNRPRQDVLASMGIKMNTMIKRFVKSESGASLVEYVLLCVLIGVVAILGMTAVGTNSNAVLGNIAASIK
jgi:Flp pilus assembly pilin Flp